MPTTNEIIDRIDESFESSPVDGVCVLSVDDWVKIKAEIGVKTNQCGECTGINKEKGKYAMECFGCKRYHTDLFEKEV
jgi:hypothetical protein